MSEIKFHSSKAITALQLLGNEEMQKRIRLGILALPASGLLATSASLIPGAWTDPSLDPAGFARASSNVALANMTGIPTGILLPIGVLALYFFLANTSVDRWALGGLLFLFAGLGFFMPFIGIMAFAAPVLGRDYMNGDINAITVITQSTSASNPSAAVFGVSAVLLIFTSSVLLAVALWRSHILPKMSGILYAIATPLWIDPLYVYQPAVAIIGSAGLLASSLWISISVTRSS